MRSQRVRSVATLFDFSCCVIVIESLNVHSPDCSASADLAGQPSSVEISFNESHPLEKRRRAFISLTKHSREPLKRILSTEEGLILVREATKQLIQLGIPWTKEVRNLGGARSRIRRSRRMTAGGPEN